MRERLLQYLGCPECGGAIEILSAAQSKADEILEGDLKCAVCALLFPIVRGVPRFVDLSKIEPDKAATAASFGWEWQHFSHTEEHYAEQFLGWIAPVKPEFFANKIVLEGGCGKGRHTRLAAEWGVRDVVAIDVSEAVETAFAATRDLPNAHVIQADIYKLPLRRSFDYAFSVGVLHHLPNPRAGFAALASKVKPGGYLSAWVYGAENNLWITRWINPLRKKITSRISPRTLLHVSKLPATALYAATKFLYAPLNKNAGGAKLAQHLFYNDYLKAISVFGWHEQHAIVFDHLIAPTAFYITRAEFEEWWHSINASDVKISWHNRNSWRGFGRLGK